MFYSVTNHDCQSKDLKKLDDVHAKQVKASTLQLSSQGSRQHAVHMQVVKRGTEGCHRKGVVCREIK